MAFHDILLPSNMNYGSKGGPGYDTAVIETDSGAEERVSRWSTARRRYDASYAIRTWKQLYDIQAFYHGRLGSAIGWRWKDWADFATTVDGRLIVNGGIANVAATDVEIGVGNGTQTVFQLVKKYSDAIVVRTRNITKPVSPTVLISFDNVTQSTGFTIDYSTGRITFTTAPANLVSVKAGCEFDIPVRFDEEADAWLSVTADSFDGASIPSIGIVELLDEGEVPEEFWYGGAKRWGPLLANVSIALQDGRVQSFEPNASGLKGILPDATNLEAGAPYFFLVNEGTFAFSIRNASDAEVISIPTGNSVAMLGLSINSGGAKTWFAK